MESSDTAADFVSVGLAAYGIEADEIELAVMTAAHATFWPPILELFDFDAGGVAAERSPDLSRPPAGRG